LTDKGEDLFNQLDKSFDITDSSHDILNILRRVRKEFILDKKADTFSREKFFDRHIRFLYENLLRDGFIELADSVDNTLEELRELDPEVFQTMEIYVRVARDQNVSSEEIEESLNYLKIVVRDAERKSKVFGDDQSAWIPMAERVLSFPERSLSEKKIKLTSLIQIIHDEFLPSYEGKGVDEDCFHRSPLFWGDKYYALSKLFQQIHDEGIEKPGEIGTLAEYSSSRPTAEELKGEGIEEWYENCKKQSEHFYDSVPSEWKNWKDSLKRDLLKRNSEHKRKTVRKQKTVMKRHIFRKNVSG
jgi:hypothetical protein